MEQITSAIKDKKGGIHLSLGSDHLCTCLAMRGKNLGLVHAALVSLANVLLLCCSCSIREGHHHHSATCTHSSLVDWKHHLGGAALSSFFSSPRIMAFIVGREKQSEWEENTSGLHASLPKWKKGAVFQRAEHLTSLILSAKVQIYLFKAVFKVTLIRELPTVRTIMIIQSINQWEIMPVAD